MTDAPENPRAVMGDNAPPPIIAHEANIADLFAEATSFLDGKPIENDGQAAAVKILLDGARAAWKAANEQRIVEKRPHDDAAQAVQDAWNPLLAKAKQVETAAKVAQTAWLNKKDAELRAAAEAAREEAERLQREAQAALASAKGDDLAARADAEDALKAAGSASKLAAKLDKAKPQVVGEGRATGLRTSYSTEVTDMTAFSRWAWAHRREEYEAFLTDLAEREGRRGPVSIPGLLITANRKAA